MMKKLINNIGAYKKINTMTRLNWHKDNQVDILHGVKVADPYRWLEDPNAKETQDFVSTQNQLFSSYIDASLRDKFKSALTHLYNYEKIGVPFKHGDWYYYYHNTGLQPQYVLHRKKSLNGPSSVFLDVNRLSQDGTISISSTAMSETARYFAYALSSSGSDWVKVYVRDTKEEADIPLEKSPLEWVKFTSLSWTHDDKGFFYTRYPKPKDLEDEKAGTETDSNTNSSIYYHYLNTNQDKDQLCFSIPQDPKHMPGLVVSFDGKYVIVTISESCDPCNKLYIASLDKFDGSDASLTFTRIVDEFKAEFSYITNDDSVFWFVTTLDAPRKRIVKYDLKHPELGFQTVIPESKDVLDEVNIADNDKLILVYLSDVKHIVKIHSLYTGQELQARLELPVGSMIQSLRSKRSVSEIFYSFSSFTSPGTIYRYDFASNETSLYQETKVNGLKPMDFFETKQVFYSSKDGTKIPMYLVYKKGLELDGSHPVLLYGYGGFNISITPRFSVSWITFIQHFHGVLAIANIRGGGEYGEEWYKQGKLNVKQNVFDDFIHGAKYLIQEKYTSPKHLAINGGSNGGLLVGACINQAPELFGCAIADVGVMDMLRFHKFTIGHAWTSDYGNPDVENDFKVLLKYSPLHNVRSGVTYPSTLICCADHDDRVVPLHSLKLLATLQDTLGANPNPIMGRIETKAGHGAGKSTSQILDESSDKYTFLAMSVGAIWKD